MLSRSKGKIVECLTSYTNFTSLINEIQPYRTTVAQTVSLFISQWLAVKWNTNRRLYLVIHKIWIGLSFCCTTNGYPRTTSCTRTINWETLIYNWEFHIKIKNKQRNFLRKTSEMFVLSRLTASTPPSPTAPSLTVPRHTSFNTSHRLWPMYLIQSRLYRLSRHGCSWAPGEFLSLLYLCLPQRSQESSPLCLFGG